VKLRIDSLDAEGRGVARTAEGKVVFVEGALPGEEVDFQVLRKKSSFEIGRLTKVLGGASSRQTPRCPHFGVCGGCSLQHTDARTQMAAKQRWLEENLARIGKVEVETLLPIVYGEEWHYRRRARLGARYVPKKGGAMVGFREKRSSYITDMRECHVLPEHVSRLILPLRDLTEKLSIRARLPQIEVAAGMPSVSADPELLKPVFANLIGNAIKFTRDAAAGRVEIGADQAAGVVTVHIHDNGVGFDDDAAKRLFAPFVRLHEGRFDGHGVGLSIVQRAVERHGGRVWAEGRPGQGATFHFSLPA